MIEDRLIMENRERERESLYFLILPVLHTYNLNFAVFLAPFRSMITAQVTLPPPDRDIYTLKNEINVGGTPLPPLF